MCCNSFKKAVRAVLKEEFQLKNFGLSYNRSVVFYTAQVCISMCRTQLYRTGICALEAYDTVNIQLPIKAVKHHRRLSEFAVFYRKKKKYSCPNISYTLQQTAFIVVVTKRTFGATYFTCFTDTSVIENMDGLSTTRNCATAQN